MYYVIDIYIDMHFMVLIFSVKSGSNATYHQLSCNFFEKKTILLAAILKISTICIKFKSQYVLCN